MVLLRDHEHNLKFKTLNNAIISGRIFKVMYSYRIQKRSWQNSLNTTHDYGLVDQTLNADRRKRTVASFLDPNNKQTTTNIA